MLKFSFELMISQRAATAHTYTPSHVWYHPQAADQLGLTTLGCGGITPGMRGKCGVSCEKETRLPPIHFVNYASTCTDATCTGSAYEERQAGYVITIVITHILTTQ